MEVIILIVSLIIILAATKLFVNAIECLGKLLKLSEGAVGSVLAALGTALPETLIPIIAMLTGNTSNAADIGIGTILGAPLMLSTLTMFVTGCAVIYFKDTRKHKDKITVNYDIISHDLKFFCFAFILAILCGFIPESFKTIKILIAVILVLSYIIYILKIVKDNKKTSFNLSNLYITFGNQKIIKSNKIIYLAILQAIIAITLIIICAETFVDAISYISNALNIPAFVLAIVITPIATELPEKFNSIIWISKEKDTLALSNITGAMMFQASILPAIGILLTDWSLTNAGTVISAALALASVTLLLTELKIKKHLTVKMLLTSGIFYLLFIILVMSGIIR